MKKLVMVFVAFLLCVGRSLIADAVASTRSLMGDRGNTRISDISSV